MSQLSEGDELKTVLKVKGRGYAELPSYSTELIFNEMFETRIP